jgi:hypothetical protein
VVRLLPGDIEVSQMIDCMITGANPLKRHLTNSTVESQLSRGADGPSASVLYALTARRPAAMILSARWVIENAQKNMIASCDTITKEGGAR